MIAATMAATSTYSMIACPRWRRARRVLIVTFIGKHHRFLEALQKDSGAVHQPVREGGQTAAAKRAATGTPAQPAEPEP